MTVLYREFRPPEALRDAVRCLWCLDRTYVAGQDTEVVWPQGSVELIVHYGDRYRLAGRSELPIAHAFIMGPLTRFVELRSPGRVQLVGARCYPWGFASLFGGPLRELRNAVLPLDVLTPSAASLEDHLSEASAEQAVAILGRYLLSRRRSAAHVPFPARDLSDVPGLSDVPSLARDRGLSVRQLERHFDAVVGVSPKQLLRIARFNSARRAILSGPSAPLLEVAYASRYADYSHMTRDFKEFLGVTPHEFVRWIRPGPLATSAEFQDVVFLQDDAEPHSVRYGA